MTSGLFLAILLAMPIGPTQNEKPSRELTRDVAPILSRIVPGDRFVTVLYPDALETPTTSESAEIELINLARIEELFTVRDLALEPYFVDNGSWIRTRVTATVTQVMNTGRRAATPNSRIEFEFDGGEMVVNGVRILAGHPPALDRAAYLVGLQFDPYRKYWEIISLFEVTRQEKLATRRLRDNRTLPVSRLHGKSLDEIAVEVAKRQQ
jgi:hypothetical protein